MGDASRAPSSGESFPDTLVPLWDERIGRSPTGAPGLGDSIVVTQASDRWVSVYLRQSGERVWHSRLKGPGATGPIFTGEQVFAASGDSKGQLHAYDLMTGKRTWHERVGPVVGPIAKVGQRVIAATRTGWVIALDAANGEARWSRPFPRPLRAGVTALGEQILVATGDSLYLLDARSGFVDASSPAPGALFSPPAVADSFVVVTSPDGFISAFHASTLEPLWEIPTNDPVFGNPAIARDTAFAVTQNGTLWMIPLEFPEDAGTVPLGVVVRAGPSPLARGVLIATVHGEVAWFVPEVAEPLWLRQFKGPIETPPVLDRGKLFILDAGGRIHVWGEPPAEQ
ncbi:MAG: PQQ-binding-like beta-propeller repeat protein [Gemmatimonadales bacterium]